MSYKIPGLSSIILLFIALGIADYQLFTVSLPLGIVYFICIPLSFLITLYNYCRKCPHVASKTCRHVLFGWIISKLFKPIQPSKYTVKEAFVSLIPLVFIVIFPQYWLVQSIGLFIAFWVLMLAAVVIVRIGVCIGCKNVNCLFCPNKDNCNA